MNEYINKFMRISSEKENDIVSKLIGKKNILEVGYYAGQMSVRLSEIAVNLTCIDLVNKFFSPDLNDHIKRNMISNIKYSLVDDVIQYVEEHHSEFDAIYVDESHDKIQDLITFLEQNAKSPLTFVYNDGETDSIKSVEIVDPIKVKEVEKETFTEMAPVSNTTAVPKKRASKQSKTTTKWYLVIE